MSTVVTDTLLDKLDEVSNMLDDEHLDEMKAAVCYGILAAMTPELTKEIRELRQQLSDVDRFHGSVDV